MKNKKKQPFDIVLFNPAPRSGVQVQRRIELPLGLLCSATPLDLEAYKIKIIDGFVNPNWKKELIQSISQKPICFGVTSMTGPQILRAIEACHIVRENNPQIPIVWGGIHASLLPEQTLKSPYADIIVEGEGEITFKELVKALESNSPLKTVTGIYYNENGQVCNTGMRDFADLDSQPPLSYHLVDINKYRRRLFGIDHVSLNSSRGCIYRCSFCWDPVLHRRKWRAMKPDTIISHIERIIRDYDIHGFLFTDDHFFIDMERAYEFLEKTIKNKLHISISKLQIRADTLCRMDKDFFKLLVKAGVKRLSIGVESGSQRILDLLRKDITIDQIISANEKLAAYPIVPVYLFMMGLPTETRDELKQSITLAERLVDENPYAVKTFNIYTPYPGTELFKLVSEMGLNVPNKLEEWSRFNFRNIPKESVWISNEMSRLIEGLDFPLMFLGKGHFVNPYKKTNPFAVIFAKMYYHFARYRIKNLDVRFPLETKLAKGLGLFARQD